MDNTLWWDARVDEQGALTMDSPEMFEAALLRFAGKKVILRVQGWTKKRSLAANSFYWVAIVNPIADYTGYTKDEVHALLKSKFATEKMWVVNEKTGEISETTVPRQTKTMAQGEFREFIDKCSNFSVSLGIQLPFYGGDRYEYAEDN